MSKRIFKTIRFKLTLIYSLILLSFALIILGIYNVYSIQYAYQEPPVTRNIEIRNPNGAIQRFREYTQEQQEAIREVRLNDLKRIQLLSLLSIIPITISSFIIGYYAAGIFLSPIGKLKKNIAQIKATNLSSRLEKSVDDEIGALVDSFNEMISRLEESFESQTRFVQDASHELKTPLAIIKTNLDSVIFDQSATKEELTEAIQNAIQGINRLDKLSKDLLELTVPPTGSDYEKLLVSDLINAEVKNLNELAENRKIKIQFSNLLKKEKLIKVNKLRFSRAIYNLIENAIKYSQSNKKIEIVLEAKSGTLIIAVSNYSNKISKENLTKMFERFYRIDKSRSREQGGFGLGLAITKKIINEHNGKISAEYKDEKVTIEIKMKLT